MFSIDDSVIWGEFRYILSNAPRFISMIGRKPFGHNKKPSLGPSESSGPIERGTDSHDEPPSAETKWSTENNEHTHGTLAGNTAKEQTETLPVLASFQKKGKSGEEKRRYASLTVTVTDSLDEEPEH